MSSLPSPSTSQSMHRVAANSTNGGNLTLRRPPLSPLRLHSIEEKPEYEYEEYEYKLNLGTESPLSPPSQTQTQSRIRSQGWVSSPLCTSPSSISASSSTSTSFASASAESPRPCSYFPSQPIESGVRHKEENGWSKAGIEVNADVPPRSKSWRSSSFEEKMRCYKMKRESERAGRVKVVDRDCGICFELAVLPTRTRCCGVIYCLEHITDWLEKTPSGAGASTGTCPSCEEPLCLSTGVISLASPTLKAFPSPTSSSNSVATSTPDGDLKSKTREREDGGAPHLNTTTCPSVGNWRELFGKKKPGSGLGLRRLIVGVAAVSSSSSSATISPSSSSSSPCSERESRSGGGSSASDATLVLPALARSWSQLSMDSVSSSRAWLFSGVFLLRSMFSFFEQNQNQNQNQSRNDIQSVFEYLLSYSFSSFIPPPSSSSMICSGGPTSSYAEGEAIRLEKPLGHGLGLDERKAIVMEMLGNVFSLVGFLLVVFVLGMP